MLAKSLKFVKSLPGLVQPYLFDLFLLVCVILIATVSYNLGRIQALSKSPLKASISDVGAFDASPGNAGSAGAKTPAQSPQPQDLRVVASKASGSKLYHHPWCSGAKRIKDTNQLWFATETEAQKAGYTLAANCQ